MESSHRKPGEDIPPLASGAITAPGAEIAPLLSPKGMMDAISSAGSSVAQAFRVDTRGPPSGSADGADMPNPIDHLMAVIPGLKPRRQRTMSEVPTFTTNPHTIMSDRVVIAMVGLPARGKSYISKAIVRYLKFLGCPAQIFNAGNKRRDEGAAGVSANFFDASNADAKAQRERMAMDTLDELLEWLQAETRPEAGCACGIFDATNTTIDRRENVRQRIAREQPPVRLIFVETICDDQKVLENNYRMKLSNDDYKGTDPEAAINDFKSRVAKYEAVYENVDDDLECRPLEEPSAAAAEPSAAAAEPSAAAAEPSAAAAEPSAAAAEPSAAAAQLSAAAAELSAAAAELSAATAETPDVSAGEAAAVGEGAGMAAGGVAVDGAAAGALAGEATGAAPTIPLSTSSSSSYHGPPPAPGCLKLIDAGRKLVVTNCEGSYVISELLSLLHSFSLAPRCIWIALVGETANDLKGILGGDSQLSTDGLEYAPSPPAFDSPCGHVARPPHSAARDEIWPCISLLTVRGRGRYARGVADYVRAREGSDELFVGGAPPEPAMVITGTLRRYQQMGEELGKANGGAKRRIVLQLRGMNELCAGNAEPPLPHHHPSPSPMVSAWLQVSSTRSLTSR